MRITLGFELWISCIASCTLYHYATRVHFTVILRVNTRYLPLKTTLASHGTCWCQTSGAGPAAPPAPAMTSLVQIQIHSGVSQSLSGSKPVYVTLSRSLGWKRCLQCQADSSSPDNAIQCAAGQADTFFHFGTCPGEFVACFGQSPSSALCT